MRNGLENSDKLSVKGEASTRPVCLFSEDVVGGVVGGEARGGICAIMCGGTISVDDDGAGVIMCLADAWLEVILNPLLDSVFVGFLGVVEVDMDAVFEKVNDAIAGLAFIVSWIVGVVDGVVGGLVR